MKTPSSFVAFPNTTVNRIDPVIHHDAPLEVTVEPYYEWIIDRVMVVIKDGFFFSLGASVSLSLKVIVKT